jgi:hypothetical protein
MFITLALILTERSFIKHETDRGPSNGYSYCLCYIRRRVDVLTISSAYDKTEPLR